MAKFFIRKKMINLLVLEKLIIFGRNLNRYYKKRDEAESIQNKNLHKFIKYVYNIPFYRKKFDECGLSPKDIKNSKDLLKLPILTKEEYKNWIKSEYNNDPVKFNNFLKDSTSGSTGTPMIVYLTPGDRALSMADWIRKAMFQKKGFNPFLGKTLAVIAEHHFKPTKDTIFQRIGILRRKTVSTLLSPEELINVYNEYKPDFFYSNKTPILLMAMYAIENDIKLHKPKCMASVAEVLDETSRRTIEQAFGKNVLYDAYGSVETGNFAFDNINEPGKHIVCVDTHIVNIIDNDGNMSSAGRPIVTSLCRRGFPVLNYALGDYVETMVENNVMYITRINGRANDFIKNSDGSVYPWQTFYNIFDKIDDVVQFRIIQESYDLLTIELVKENRGKKTEEEIEQIILERADRIFINHKKKIRFLWKKMLEADASGKLRMLISMVN